MMKCEGFGVRVREFGNSGKGKRETRKGKNDNGKVG
jgi:hypothetical protein